MASAIKGSSWTEQMCRAGPCKQKRDESEGDEPSCGHSALTVQVDQDAQPDLAALVQQSVQLRHGAIRASTSARAVEGDV